MPDQSMSIIYYPSLITCKLVIEKKKENRKE